MDVGLDGRVYLVTGGSRGLGFAAAQALVADGARVVLSAPHEGTASSAVARLAQNAAAAEPAAWVIADNADPATSGLLIAAARDRFGRLDGALISVGGSPSGTVATTTDEEWRSAFESVFAGACGWPGSWRQIWAARAGPSRGGGSIVFVRASSVRLPLVELAISNGLFPGLAGVVKTMAGELGPAGIRVNGLLPVRIATDRVRELDALQGDPDEVRARLSQNIPLRRYGEPRGVRAGGGVRALPRRVLHHRRDDPRRWRCHQLNLSTRSRAWLPAAALRTGSSSNTSTKPGNITVRTISGGHILGGINQSGIDDRLPEASTTARSETHGQIAV